jgi:aspartyl protease family protein
MVFIGIALSKNKHMPGEPIWARLSSHTLPGTKRYAAAGATNILFLFAWIAIAAVAYFAMQAFTAPKVARETGSANGGSDIVIPRSRDGHYYVEGSINGQPVTFMVDTGASTVSVDTRTAQTSGMPRGYSATFNTASGETQGEMVPKQRISVGGFRIDDISVAVIPRLGEIALLG